MKAIGRAPQRQQGVSLIELMVALVIGLLVMLGATQIFIEGRQSLSRLDELAWRQSKLNYVASTMFREIRVANADVAPAPGNPSHLKIEFDEATGGYDPYCGAGLLAAVEYFKPSDDDSLRVQVVCSTGNLYPPAGVEVIDGVTALEFRGDGTSAGSTYIEVDISFTLLPGESSATADVDFLVANRKKVVESLNL